MAPLKINTAFRLKSGHEIPLLGFGVYKTPPSETEEVVTQALKAGYRHIDGAAGYRNEEACGAAIRRFAESEGVPRSELFFTSKVPVPAISYEGASKCVDETLRLSGLDYIDLYLVHAPRGGREARLGAWRALVEAVEAGKVRSIGVSNYGVHHLKELEEWIKETEAAKGKGKGGVLSVNQVELHPWLTRSDIVSWCEERGVLLEAFAPLVRGQRASETSLVALAEKYNKTWAQVLVRWSLQKGWSPLPKSATPARIVANADVYDFDLTSEDMKSLETDVYEPCAWDPTVTND